MKRFLACVLGVAVLAVPAAAQPGTVWIQATDGSDTIDLAPSQTAIVQLWLTINDGSTMVGMDAALAAYDSVFGKNINFEIQGFVDPPPVLPGGMQFLSRGDVVGQLPNGNPDDYLYFGIDLFMGQPTGLIGTPGPVTVLLDEIIIHAIDNPLNPTGLPSSDILGFSPTNPPGSFILTLTPPVPNPPAEWEVLQGTLSLGTGNFNAGTFMTINVPEPATLGMLFIAGLAAIRRRQ